MRIARLRTATVLVALATALPVAGVAPSHAASHAALTPSMASSKPGALLSSSALTSSPNGSRGYSIRYRSVSVAGQPIEVTGVAYVPNRAAPAKGWPVLSYAHGTVGIADRCTPSKNIGQIETLMAGTFNSLGIAVVATDYEGLGTPGRHPYIVGASEARGVIDAVRALRAIPNEKIATRYTVWGHSQGGHAALFTGQTSAGWAPELTLTGVVAGAPPSQLTTVSDSLTTSPYRGYLLMVVAGMAAAYPDLDLSKVLTPKGQEVLGVVDRACNQGIFDEVAKYPLDDLVIRSGLSDPAWSAALASNDPGAVKIAAPVLIVHGDRDEQIPVATSAVLQRKLCTLGTNVTRMVYKGANHGGAALASLLDVSAWLADRLNGVPAKKGCPASSTAAKVTKATTTPMPTTSIL